jgi:L-malate glycosyltransferase
VEALAPRAAWDERRRTGAPVRILWTRQLKPIYDPETMIRALGGLKRLGVPFRAVIAGGGPMQPALEAMAGREGVSGGIRFEGFVDESRLAALYRDADFYVSLSLSDSTSQSLLEAMAAGLFPLVTDIAGNREWITHRREGYLVPPRDPEAVAYALAEAAREPEAARITERARAAVLARGSFRATLDELEARLRGLAAAPRRVGAP